MIGAGKLDRKITFQHFTTTTDEFNAPVQAWADFVVVRARREDVSDSEKFSAEQVGSSLLSRFVIRSTAKTRKITPQYRIKYGQTSDSPPADAIWSIKGVKEAQHGRFRFLEITAVKDSD